MLLANSNVYQKEEILMSTWLLSSFQYYIIPDIIIISFQVII